MERTPPPRPGEMSRSPQTSSVEPTAPVTRSSKTDLSTVHLSTRELTAFFPSDPNGGEVPRSTDEPPSSSALPLHRFLRVLTTNDDSSPDDALLSQ